MIQYKTSIYIVHRQARAKERSKTEKPGYRITQAGPCHLQKALIRTETIHAKPIPRLLINKLCPLPVHRVQSPRAAKQRLPTLTDARSTPLAATKRLRTLQGVREERVEPCGASNEASLINRLAQSPGEHVCVGVIHSKGIKYSRQNLGQVALPCKRHRV